MKRVKTPCQNCGKEEDNETFLAMHLMVHTREGDLFKVNGVKHLCQECMAKIVNEVKEVLRQNGWYKDEED